MRHYLKFTIPVLLLVSIVSTVEACQKCESDVLITIDREACFGNCPIYSAQIYKDGTVVYVGKEFVKTVGERRHKISKESIEALIKEFEKIDYWSLKDEYRTDEQGNS